MKEDQNQDAYFTTMFDLYALPGDFPDYDKAMRKPTPYEVAFELFARTYRIRVSQSAR